MTDDTVDRLPDRRQVLALIGAHNANRSKHAKDNKALADRFTQAAENGNVHVKAAKLVAAWARMEELARNDFLRHLDAYREWAENELFSKNKHMGDLAEEAEKKAAADKQAKDEADQVELNKKRLKGGIKKLDAPEGETGGAGLTEEERQFDGATSDQPPVKRPAVGMPGAVGEPVH